MNWLIVGGTLVGVLVLAATAGALRRGGGTRIASPQAAAAAAQTALAGFEAAECVVGADGAGALAIGVDGRLVAIKRRGIRIVRWADVRSAPGGAVIETGERRFGVVRLVGVDAIDLRRLAGQPEMTQQEVT